MSKINCPGCKKELEIDSVRKHKDGRERIYWECDKCNISVMRKYGPKI